MRSERKRKQWHLNLEAAYLVVVVMGTGRAWMPVLEVKAQPDDL